MNKLVIILLSLVTLGIAYRATTNTQTESEVKSFANIKDVPSCTWTYYLVGDVSVQTKVSLYDIDIVSPKGLPSGYTVEGGYGLLEYEKYVNKSHTSNRELTVGQLLALITPSKSTLVSTEKLTIKVKSNCLQDPDQTPKDD